MKDAGFTIAPHRMNHETVSGSLAASQRPEFSKLLERMEAGDILVVTKLDRLGRNAIDVAKTVETLETWSIKVHCLALGGVDLTSSAPESSPWALLMLWLSLNETC